MDLTPTQHSEVSQLLLLFLRQHCMKFAAQLDDKHYVTKDIPLIVFSANPFMSPRNDVNRMANVARGLGPLQHNIALDSSIDEKESIGPLKSQDFCAT